MGVEPLTRNTNTAAGMRLISVPKIRVRQCNSAPVCADGRFVLYWMIAFRRATWNFALDRAVEWAERLGKPLVVLEALRCDYPWASDRMHSFILDGMAENACRFEGTGVLHYPFVEFEPNAGKGLLRAMAAHACVLVTDDFPCFFLPRMVAAAASQVPVRRQSTRMDSYPCEPRTKFFSPPTRSAVSCRRNFLFI
jgi:deoxyribodipyrimidine photo-lyase